MNEEEITQQMSHLSKILVNVPTVGCLDLCNENPDSGLPESLSQLTLYPLMKKLTEIQEQISWLHYSQNAKATLRTQAEVDYISCEVKKFVEEITDCLKFISSNALKVENALKNPAIKNSLALPHHLHSKAVQLVESCMWLIENREWHPVQQEIPWDKLFLQMDMEMNEWNTLLQQMKRCYEENKYLRRTTKKLFENEN